MRELKTSSADRGNECQTIKVCESIDLVRSGFGRGKVLSS